MSGSEYIIASVPITAAIGRQTEMLAARSAQICKAMEEQSAALLSLANAMWSISATLSAKAAPSVSMYELLHPQKGTQ